MNVFKKWALNKYVLTPFGLLIWLLFFDNNDVLSIIEWKSYLGELKDEKVYYRKRIEESKNALIELSSDMNSLEKYARERYYMKKENEDIFLILEAEK